MTEKIKPQKIKPLGEPIEALAIGLKLMKLAMNKYNISAEEAVSETLRRINIMQREGMIFDKNFRGWYHKQKISGMCVTCGKRPAELGYTRCKICRAKAKESQDKFWKRGKYKKEVSL